MRILLIQPDSRVELIGWGDMGAISEPLALEYIASAVSSADHDMELLDLRLHKGTLPERLEHFKPDLVAVTGYSMHVLRILAICREVKSALPDCRTIVGGHHATLLPEDFFAPEIDHVVCGEGVGPFRELILQLDDKVKTPMLSGSWTNIEGEFVKGPEAKEFEVDEIPLPNRHISLADRESYFIDWMKPIALMRNTVGCPYRCSFCSLWKIMDGRYYKRSVAQVVEELSSIEEEFVFLVDDEAFIDIKRMMELSREIEAAGIQKKYFTYCRIDTLLRSPELMQAWRKIGLERLFIGIESIRDADLEDFNKRLKVTQIEEGLSKARELGIQVFAGFIVHPDFKEKDFKRLVRFITHNKIDYPSFTIWTPLPGTDALETFDDVIERQSNGRPNWDLFDLQNPVVKTHLGRDKFMKEYYNLHKTFGPKITQYRDVIKRPTDQNQLRVS